MTGRLNRVLWVTSLAVLLAGLAAPAPASAQNGTVAGKIVDQDGKDAGEVTVILDFVGEPKRQFKLLTDRYGEWYKSGVPAGTYTITATKETIEKTVKVVRSATMENVAVKPGEKLRVPNIAIMTDADRAAGKRAPQASSLSAAEAEAANKRAAELDNLFKGANAAIAAGKYAEAVASLTALAEKTDKCGRCFVKIGEIELKRDDQKAAEAAFLKAIELDPANPDPYSQLAAVYNGLRRFDEAAKMGAKAGELMGALGSTDPIAVYNQGVILWNAGNVEGAQKEFARAVALDPKRANSQYFLGMTTFVLASSGTGKLTDARAPLQEYLKLAPTGEYAANAKEFLASIK